MPFAFAFVHFPPEAASRRSPHAQFTEQNVIAGVNLTAGNANMAAGRGQSAREPLKNNILNLHLTGSGKGLIVFFILVDDNGINGFCHVNIREGNVADFPPTTSSGLATILVAILFDELADTCFDVDANQVHGTCFLQPLLILTGGDWGLTLTFPSSQS